MDNAANGSVPPGSPPALTYGLRNLLNNAGSSTVSTLHTAPTGESGTLTHSTPSSPSISAPLPPLPKSSAKIGIYGWRKRCLYLLILLILVVAILNLALTVWIIRVVRLSSDGLGPVEIGDQSVHIYGDVDFLGAVHASEVKSVGETPLIIESAAKLRLRAGAREGDGDAVSALTMTDDTMHVQADDFHVTNGAGDTLLRATIGADLGIGAGNEDVSVQIVGDGGVSFPDSVETAKIKAPASENLEISSRTNRIDFFGAYGVDVAAKSGGIRLRAMDDVSVVSKRGKVTVDADLRILDLPLVGNRDKDSNLEAYQLCICDNGRLFLARADESCLSTTVCQ